MAYAGLSRDAQRADLIAFLRQHADSPPPLPTAAK
jgi:cytochrome c